MVFPWILFPSIVGDEGFLVGVKAIIHTTLQTSNTNTTFEHLIQDADDVNFNGNSLAGINSGSKSAHFGDQIEDVPLGTKYAANTNMTAPSGKTMHILGGYFTVDNIGASTTMNANLRVSNTLDTADGNIIKNVNQSFGFGASRFQFPFEFKLPVGKYITVQVVSAGHGNITCYTEQIISVIKNNL